MSDPVQRVPGTFYALARCCDRREFRFTPDEQMQAAFTVVMSDACQRYDIQLAGWVLMSNHVHYVIYDRLGTASEFMRDVHATLARVGNKLHGRAGMRFWDPQQDNLVAIKDLDCLVDHLAYIILNPVRAGLVAHPNAWPNPVTRVEDIGTGDGPVEQRPDGFFRPDGPVSEWGQLASELPPHIDADEVRRRVAKKVREGAECIRRQMFAEGRKFAGAERVKACNFWDTPVTFRAHNVGFGATARPRVGARDREILAAAVAELVRFRQRYRRARIRFALGERDVIFPPGTYALHRFYGVRRAPPPADRAAL